MARRIRVRTSHQQEFTRLAGTQAALLQVAGAQAVAALFQQAHYDWNDPLSARAFQQWRDGQMTKFDEVSTVSSPQAPSQSFTQIHTVAAEGELEAAILTLNTEDYPVEERLEFRDREWVELTEIAEASTESAGGVAAGHVERPERAAEMPNREATLAPEPPASVSDEIQVLSALSAIDADLGDAIEVSLSDGKVKVIGGEGISLRRQNEIRASLARLPQVELVFTPSHPAALLPETIGAVAGTAVAPASPMQVRLEKHLGGHAEFDRFSTQLLDLDEAAMQRVYALRHLAQKFPAGDEAQLSSGDLNVLHEITRKHTGVLSEKLSAMERMLFPALSALGGTPASVHTAVAGSWQPAAEDLFQHGHRVEVLIAQMLGMTPGASSVGALPSELLTALKDLRGNLEDLRRFLPAR